MSAGVFSERPIQYFAPLTSLRQRSDLHKAAPLHLPAHHRGTFPVVPSSSSGFRVHLQVQCSLPEWSTTAFAPNEQEGPDISLLSSLLQSQWDHSRNAHLSNVVIKPQANTKVWWTCSMPIHTNGWRHQTVGLTVEGGRAMGVPSVQTGRSANTIPCTQRHLI